MYHPKVLLEGESVSGRILPWKNICVSVLQFVCVTYFPFIVHFFDTWRHFPWYCMCSNHHIKSSKRWSKKLRRTQFLNPLFFPLAFVRNEPGAWWKNRASSGTRPWDGALCWGEDWDDVLGIPEELHLGWRLRVCVGGVCLGAPGTQTGAGRLFKVLLH